VLAVSKFGFRIENDADSKIIVIQKRDCFHHELFPDPGIDVMKSSICREFLSSEWLEAACHCSS